MSLTTRLLSTFLFSTMCAPLSLSQTVPSQQPGSTVEGKVIQEPGGAPIRKVVVRLQGTKEDTEQFTSAAAEGGMDEDIAAALIGRFGGEENSQENQHFTTSTDSAGHFRIEGVPPGKYMVFISRDGYVPAKQKHADLIVTVTAGRDLSDLVYKMEPAGFIAGKIVDAEGDPVAGVAVQAMLKGKASSANDSMSIAYAVLGSVGAIPGLGTTNDLGEYRISGLRAGEYLVIARPQGNLGPPPSSSDKGHPRESLFYTTTYYPGALDQKQASAVQVLSGSAASANFTLQTSRAYRVSGTIAGMNAAGFIILFSSSGRPQQQSLKGGRFDFPSVQPGTYIAQIIEQRAEGTVGEPKTLRVQTPIIVTGSDLTDLVLQPLTEGGTVSGKFRIDGQDAVDWKQMYVSLLPVDDAMQEVGDNIFVRAFAQQGSSGALKEDGSFELKNVAAGNYQLAVGTANNNYRDWYLKSVLLGGREVADPGFAVSGDTTLEVVVSPKGPSIEGTVVDADSKPVPEVFVSTMPSSGKLGRPDSYQQGRSDANGHFVLRGLNPGEFVVVALETPPGNAHNADFFEKYGTRGTKVELAEGEKKNVTVTLISDGTK